MFNENVIKTCIKKNENFVFGTLCLRCIFLEKSEGFMRRVETHKGTSHNRSDYKLSSNVLIVCELCMLQWDLRVRSH